ncbi:aspartic peptidase domain-containing protein [Aspergillus pseudoustus]|uniref:Aspartic peptidase domain-containing protein n=1 Tax=Aspergillus pseudoustus TaxID=1810923 RepID=A0ABR4KLY7_9EURO
MRLSQCLLSAAFLYGSAHAFIPYRFKVKTAPSGSDSDGLDRRFVPVKLLSGDISLDDKYGTDSHDDDLLSLDTKDTHARRDNIYKVVLADKPTSPNTVALHQDGLDYSYFATVNVGTPGQPVWMMLDTGGANTWVFGEDCTAKPCQMHNTFGEDSSSTVKTTTDKFQVGYGSGNVSGILVTDHLAIAGINVEMTFGLAREATDDFINYPIDGILGLGRSNDTSMGRSPFMDLVAKQGDLEKNIVSFHLSRSSDGARDGTVTFGGVDTTKFTGDIAYTVVADSSIHWSIPLDDVNVNGKDLGFKNKFAIIDTGTSYSLLPPEDAAAVHALIPGSKQISDENYILPCDSTADVQFTFSGKSYSMSPKDYIGARLEDGDGCISTIIAQAVFGDDVWILGDTFLKNVYVVFDFDQDRIGFAELTHPPTTQSTTTTTAGVAAPTDTFSTEGAGSGSDSSESTDTTDSAAASSPSETHSEFKGAGITKFSVPNYYWAALAGLLYLYYL